MSTVTARATGLAPKSFWLRDLPLDGRGPLHGQIYRSIRAAILDGRVAAGTRLPPTRVLARELGLSRNTVLSAFEPLRAEGYVVSRVGSGTFVAPQVEARPAHTGSRSASPRRVEAATTPLPLSRYGAALAADPPRRDHDALAARPPLPFDFRPCVPDLARLPDEAWRRALTRTASYLPSDAWDYGDPAGVPELREAIAGYLGRARGIRCDASEILIVGGVAQALDLASRVFIDRGDAVLVEDPHYLGARRVFASAGARLVGAPVDSEGIDLSALPGSAKATARLAYVTPSHQFPTGAVMSLARRLELLRWANEQGAFVLEDDYDSEFRYAGRAIEALKSLDEQGHVLYVGTFSKTLLPGLRLAFLVLPPRLVELFRSAKWLADWASPVFEQHALARFLEAGDFERHLRRARTLYARGRAALVAAIERELAPYSPLYTDHQAGLHLLVRFPELAAREHRALVEAGLRRGVGLYPAAPCYLAEGPGALELTLGFARLDEAAIGQGVAELGALLRDHPRRSRGAANVRH